MKKAPIPFAPGYYANRSGDIFSGEKILKRVIKRETRYVQVCLGSAGVFLAHRVIAIVFYGEKDGMQVNHKNGIRSDNRLENLEWVTPSENVRHGFRQLGRINPFKGKVSGGHPTSKAVIATSIKTGEEVRFECALDAVRSMGADSSGISRACNGLIKHHAGHYWQYVGAWQAMQEAA